jgi:hypothetical protein
MSKRRSGQFKPSPKDFYPTPRKAVLPLVPHLRGVRSFAEPCAGAGDLVRHLESFGLACVYAGDIATGQDALDLTPAAVNGAAIITNPPFSEEMQPLLRRMLAHFREIAPTWLLLPGDFAFNKWFEPLLPCCTDIVSIRRVQWIPNTPSSGMENFAWYRFDARHAAGPIFHGRDTAAVSSRASRCTGCGRPYRPQRSTSRFCGDACRQRAHRSRSGFLA